VSTTGSPEAEQRSAQRASRAVTAPRLVRRPVPPAWHTLAAAGETPILARLLAARGVERPEDLRSDLAALPNWQTLANAAAAADRLARAIAARERILIVADYDADGATACATGLIGLRAMGAEVDFLVPNRFEFGYGLTPEIVDLAAERAPRVIVTVDNGIASVEGVACARAQGIDVVITDHHLPGDVLPDTPWIVDPNQPGCAFPSRNLAGVGVMFYVLLALRAALRAGGGFRERPEPRLADLLDLVALGTVADVVRLDALNRLLVGQGLARIRSGASRPGIDALFAVAGRDRTRATAFDLGFVCGPRINAAGRLADMRAGIACLVSERTGEARALAEELDRLNRERKAIESGMLEEAIAHALERVTGESTTICLHDPGWHQGVVGLVASRLKDRLHRPAVVFAPASDGTLRGSGRSVAALHLRDAIDLVAKRHPGLILRFGGHAAAAGLTIAAADFDRFAEAFEATARGLLTPADLEREIVSDGALDAAELTLGLAQALRERVWGQGFPQPAFDDEFAVAEQRVVGGAHLRLALARDGRRYEAILFRHTEPLPARVRAVYRPEVNEWQGSASLQLVVEHWLPA
jgi:single-stranded-DNA-specific exonuclease